MHSVFHLAASSEHVSSSVDSALMTPRHYYALWAQLLHRYLLCEEGLRPAMIPPLNLMNTIGHCGCCYQNPTIIESRRITKAIVLSELSTLFKSYWQLWYKKQCSWGNRWYQNTLRTLRIGTIMVSWWLLNMVTDNTGKVQVLYCSSGRILLAADNTGQEARQPLSTPHCSGVKNVKNKKTSLLRN